jgi:hypothetical protein
MTKSPTAFLAAAGMICRRAAPLARYRWRQQRNTRAKEIHQLDQLLSCSDRNPHRGLPGKTGRHRQFLPGARDLAIRSTLKMLLRTGSHFRIDNRISSDQAKGTHFPKMLLDIRAG